MKSFLDSPGVRLSDLEQTYKIPTGGYKLFTCKKYRRIVFHRLKRDLMELGLGAADTKIDLGLIAGNIYQNRSEAIRAFLAEQGIEFRSPEDIKEKVMQMAKMRYENEPSIITAKILLRGN